MRIKSIAKCGITFTNGSKLQEIHIQGTNKTFVNWKDIDDTDEVKQLEFNNNLVAGVDIIQHTPTEIHLVAATGEVLKFSVDPNYSNYCNYFWGIYLNKALRVKYANVSNEKYFEKYSVEDGEEYKG